MQVWELAMSLDILRHAPIVLLSLKGKARESILELNIATLNATECIKKLYQLKIDTLFLEVRYTFVERCEPVGLYGIQVFWVVLKTKWQFNRWLSHKLSSLLWKIKSQQKLLLGMVLAYQALKSANLTLERLVKATVGKLTLSAMSRQLKNSCIHSIPIFQHLILYKSWWKVKCMLCMVQTTRWMLMRCFMVAVLIDILVFLVTKLVIIVAEGDVTRIQHASLTKI